MSSSSAPQPPSTVFNPHSDICDFYLVKKKRFCKIVKRCVELQRLAAVRAVAKDDGMSAAPAANNTGDSNASAGNKNDQPHQQQHFCAMHQQELAAGIAVGNGVARGDAQRGLVSGMVAEVDRRGLRVPCPLNPNHTVYEKDVQRHIKICPDRRFIVTNEPYYVKSLHAFAGCFRYDVGTREPPSTSESKVPTAGSCITVNRVPVVPITNDMEADLEMKAAIVTASKEVKAGSNIKDQQDTKRNAKISADKQHQPISPSSQTVISQQDSTDVVEGDDEEHMPIEDEDTFPTITSTASSSSPPKKRYTHRDLPPATLASLIDRIHHYYHEHVSKHVEVLDTISDFSDEEEVKKVGGELLGGGQQQNLKHDPQHDRLHKLILPLLVGGGDDVLTVVEMGAGKAGLGASLVENLLKPASTTNSTSPNMNRSTTRTLRVLVSDLGGFRRKADAGAQALISRSLASSFSPPNQLQPKVLSYKRLRCNLKDLNLPAALLCNNISVTNTSGVALNVNAALAGTKREREDDTTVSTSRDEFISIGKHLCGACTDFALSCTALGSSSASAASCFESSSLSLLVGGGRDDQQSSTPCCKGLVIATCCHHRCEPQHMCFPQSVSSTFSVTSSNSGIVAERSAPYFIPSLDELTQTKTKASLSEEIDSGACVINTLEELHALISMTSWAVSGAHAVPNPRHRDAGRNAKRIIDFHRAMFLERILNSQQNAACEGASQGQRYRVRMVEYISSSITPENLALVVDIVAAS